MHLCESGQCVLYTLGNRRVLLTFQSHSIYNNGRIVKPLGQCVELTRFVLPEALRRFIVNERSVKDILDSRFPFSLWPALNFRGDPLITRPQGAINYCIINPIPFLYLITTLIVFFSRCSFCAFAIGAQTQRWRQGEDRQGRRAVWIHLQSGQNNRGMQHQVLEPARRHQNARERQEGRLRVLGRWFPAWRLRHQVLRHQVRSARQCDLHRWLPWPGRWEHRLDQPDRCHRPVRHQPGLKERVQGGWRNAHQLHSRWRPTCFHRLPFAR